MLDALKSGSYANTETALDKGASAKLGITFMFKIHKLYDASVAIPLIKLLKERQPAEPARPASRAQSMPAAAGEAAGGAADVTDGKSAATKAVKLAIRMSASAGSSLAGMPSHLSSFPRSMSASAGSSL